MHFVCVPPLPPSLPLFLLLFFPDLGDARQGVSCYIPAGEIPVAVGKKRAGSSMSLGQWQQPPRPRSKEGDERPEGVSMGGRGRVRELPYKREKMDEEKREGGRKQGKEEGRYVLEDFEGVGFEADMFSFHADIHASELQTIPGGNACDICTLSTRV